MHNAPGWLPDPARAEQERYWNGSDWTDQVRPIRRRRSAHLPEHVPHLQRALAAATADIDAVEERLSSLFERTEGAAGTAGPRPPAKTLLASSRAPGLGHGPEDADLDAPIELEEEEAHVEDVDGLPVHAAFAGSADQGGGGDDGSLAELDAALAAEEPEEPEEPNEPEAPEAPRAWAPPTERKNAQDPRKPEKVKRGFLRPRS